MSKKFTILTDHISHVYVRNLKFQHGKLYRWALRLQNYVFDIKHIKGQRPPAGFISRTVERVDFCANDLDDNSVLVRPLNAGFDQDLTTSVYAKRLYPPRTLCAPLTATRPPFSSRRNADRITSSAYS